MGTPDKRSAQHAPACFFVPVPARTHFMVAQVGPTTVGPVSSFTGSSNPAWATTL
ncbi:hypothetical protein ACTM34_23455 [Citrobacter freundii]